MRSRQTLIAIAASLLLVGIVVIVLVGNGDDGAGNPDSEISVEQATAPLPGAPAELAGLREEANELLPGGVDALEARLAELEGHPVVINKWASWCGPCRFEFPFFQEQAAKRGDEVAFLGIDSNDSDDAARTFLEELPLPYPSYTDPEQEIAESLDAHREFPATVFIDSSGEQVYVKRGGYASEDDLIADIERYAN
jgi:cytochrome c biogenesis protein CcmG, thiol:disulfide interchange protein DsbE